MPLPLHYPSTWHLTEVNEVTKDLRVFANFCEEPNRAIAQRAGD